MTVIIDGTTGITSPSDSLSGNLTFTGTGNRITGDFSNATVANRALFQTSTTNGNTTIGVLPNGTATTTGVIAGNNSDPTNWSFVGMNATSSEARYSSGISGTGTYLPMTFYTGGSERLRIDTSGNLLFNSGYGSVATAYGCRAWVNFNGTGTVAIRASGNVSSITDGGTGIYTVNFTTAIPDANYATTAQVSSAGFGNTNDNNVAPTVNAVQLRTTNNAATVTDYPYVHVAIFR